MLAATLGVGVVEAGPGDQVTRYPLPASSSFPLADVQPSVAVGIHGDFVLVWASQVQGLDQGIYGRRFNRDGVPLGSQFRVSQAHMTISFGDGTPVVAMDADGDFVVVWLAADATSGTPVLSLLGQRFKRTGEPEGAVFTVNTLAHTPRPDGPVIAMDDDGDFAVAWIAADPDLDHASTFVRRFSAAARPQGNEFRVNWISSAANFGALFPKIAMSASGSFVVIWRQNETGTRNAMLGRRFNASGVAQGAEFIVANGQRSGVGADLATAMDATGDFVVAFNRLARPGAGDLGIFARRYSALGVPQGAEFQVSRGGRLPFTGEIAAAMDIDGDFVVAWIANHSAVGFQALLHIRLFRASGVPVTSDRQFAFTSGPGWSGSAEPRQPTVDMDGQGNFVTAWQQFGPNPDGNISADGGTSSENIFFQRFGGPEDIRPACSGFIASRVGTVGSDVITGTPEEDVIQALSGSDAIFGRGGDDVICGASGNDQLFGEGGSDRLYGGGGDDVLDGGAQQDFCDGGNHVNADTALGCENSTAVP
jgi:hypothetical protein